MIKFDTTKSGGSIAYIEGPHVNFVSNTVFLVVNSIILHLQ